MAKKYYQLSDVVIQPLPVPAGNRFKDLTGEDHNHWYVIGYAGRLLSNRAYYWCQCSCGRITTVESTSITRGTSKCCSECTHKYKKKSSRIYTKKPKSNCIVPECPDDAIAKGYCIKHYNRMNINGTLETKTNERGTAIKWLKNAIITESNKCIEWPFSRQPKGYGTVVYNGKTMTAHRVALILHSGVNPSNMEAAHLPLVCHNRSCINPRHLRWATPKENSADMKVDNTLYTAIGEEHHKAKLTESDVINIRRDTRKVSEIATEYNMSTVNIYAIKNRKIWKHI